MKKHNLVLFYSCFCSLIFALFYYFLFVSLYDSSLHIPYLQVGIYEKEESLIKCQKKLTDMDVLSYVIHHNQQQIVVCGFQDYEQVKEQLDQKKIKYVEKELYIENQELISLWEQEKYQEVLERMEEVESKRNDSG